MRRDLHPPVRSYRRCIGLIIGCFLGSSILAQPTIVSNSITDVSPCNASTNGSSTITIRKNGTSQFTYTIYKSFPVVTQTIGPTNDTVVTFSNLERWTYTLIIKWDLPSSSGFFSSFTIGGPAALSIASESATNISCHGLSDGQISVTASGETGSYKYELFNSTPAKLTENSSGTFPNLSEDDYTVRVSDLTCATTETSSTLHVNNPDAISISSVNTVNVSCNGSSDGQIQAAATGGTGTLTYTLTPGSVGNTNGTYTGLSAGTYNISVTDANSCPAAVSGPVLVSQPDPLNASVSSTAVTCNGSSDGTITISSPSGGSGTYEYSINGGSTWHTSGSYTGLGPATYDVRIRDKASPSCQVTLNNALVISEPAALSATVASTNVTCYGGSNGTITISSPAGGSGQYEYSDNGGSSWQAGGSFTSVSAGTYDVRIRDKNNPACEKTLNGALSITQPNQLNATVSSVNVTGCYGSTNGSITISSPTGGSGSYEYTINGGTTWQTSGSYTNLAAGTYNVQIRDKNVPTCSRILNSSLVITQPAPLTATVTTKNVNCYGGNDGEIKFSSPSGGSGSYQYSVNGGTVWRTNGTFSVTAVPSYPISAATYTLMMRNTLNPYCTTSLGTVTITQPNQLNATINVTQVTCNGSADGSITFASPTGGSGVYQYSIDGGSSWSDSPSFTMLAPGTYNAQIRDKNTTSCSRILNSSVSITQPVALSATVSSTNVTCNGSGDGTITISNPQGGYGTYEYTVNGGTSWQSSGNFTGLAPATYNVMMRDAANTSCTKTLNSSLVITEPNVLSATVNSTNVSCHGGNDGTISLSNPQGGYGTYEYTINGGTSWQASGSFANLTASTYDVRIRDAAHITCEVVLNAALSISEPAVLTATVAKTDVTGCYGNANGTITISSPSGGSGLYEYTINGGSSWQASGTFTGLAAGTYDIRIRDASATSCQITLNAAVVLSQPALLNGTVTHTDVTCNGGMDGSITVTSPSGGSGSYQYSITGFPWQASGTFSGLSAGSYDVFIRDAANPTCQRTLATALAVSQPAQLNATVASTNVSCNGGNDGSITISNPSGGSGTYEYSVDGGANWQSSGTFSALTAGTYDVRIRDAAHTSCSRILNGTLVITQPAALNATVNKTDVTCYNGNDGSITISSPSGGYGTYEYTINGGTSWQASGTFSGLVAGTYDVRIRDAAHTGCSTILNASLVISQPGLLGATVNHTDVTCFNGNDGSITISGPSGGSGTYEYTINGGTSWQASGTFSSLVAGTYDVQIRDAAHTSCAVTLDAALVITQPAVLGATVNKTDVTCNSSADGTITISSPAGGSGSYEYSIDGGSNWQASGSYNGLSAGSYDVRIRDAANPACEKTLNPALLITQPNVLSATVTKTDITCNGNSDGTITITNPQGGYGTYEYSIDGGSSWQASGSYSGLSAGSYDVRIRDAAYPTCTVTLDPALSITEPAALNAAVNKTDVTGCFGNTNGNITISSPSGGSGSYEYTIDGGTTWQSSGTFNNIAAGTYDVRIRDAASTACELTLDAALIIDQPAQLYGEVAITDVLCHGYADGTITISNVSGGSGNYEYSINGGSDWQASASFDSLTAGNYSVYIRDALTPSCTLLLMDPAIVNEPEELTLAVTKKDLTCHGIPDGEITITPAGGSGSFNYSIDNGTSFQDSGHFTSLAAGHYDILVKDIHGCIATDTLSLIQPDSLVIYNEVSVDESCPDMSDGSIQIIAGGGYGNLVYSIDGGLTYSDNGGIFPNLPENVYQSAVKDENGCYVTGNYLPVLSPPAIFIDSVKMTDVTCNGTANGSITIFATGGAGTLQYSIDGGATFADNGGVFTNLDKGTYMIAVADSGGCIKQGDTLSIKEPSALQDPDVVITNISCSGQTDGEILVTPNGGTAPYSYILKVAGVETDTITSTGPAHFTNLSANTYTVVVSDTFLCGSVETPSLVIAEPSPMAIDSVSSQPITCPSLSTGAIQIYGHGGTPVKPSQPYEFSIDGGANWDTVQYQNLPAGTYYTALRDGRGCYLLGDTVTLADPPSIHIDDLQSTDVTGCWFDSTGTITVTASGGQGTLYYNIGAGYASSGSFSDLGPGVYTVTVQDSKGCTDTAGVVTVSSPAPILATIRTTDVNGDVPGSIAITASGGTGALEFSVDSGASFAATDSFPGLSSGKYYVVVRDQNDCRFNDSVWINEISSIQVATSITPVSCHGGNDGVISMVADLGVPPYQYSNDNGANFYDIGYFSDLSAGNYIIMVRDNSGHRFRDTVTVSEPDLITAIASIDKANCSALMEGSSDIGAITLNVSGGNGDYTYEWTSNGQTVGTDKDLNQLTAGTYSVLITDSKGCTATKLYTVDGDSSKVVSITTSADQNVCGGIPIDLSVSSPGAVSYKWTRLPDGTEISTLSSVTVQPDSSTSYAVMAYNSYDCAAYDTVNVTIKPVPELEMVRDTLMLGGTSLVLPLHVTDTAALQGTTFEWNNTTWLDDPAATNPTFTPDRSQETYDLIVTATTSEGCMVSDTITIDVLWDLMVPSGFSPNNDGYNDVWYIPAAALVRVDVQVFNRWGEKMYSASHYKNDWDGTYNGKHLPLGTYYYVVSIYAGGKIKTYTGPLTILVQPK